MTKDEALKLALEWLETHNLIVDTRSIAPDETYTFPELVGQALEQSGFISTIASAATSLTIRANGREITS